MQSSDDIARMLAGAGRKRRRWPWVVLVLLILAGVAGWYYTSNKAGAAAVRYTTETVAKGDLVVVVTATGTVQPTTEVEVSSELSGTLASVSVDYNDEVKVGQILAHLDTTKLVAQVDNARAQLAAAKARVTQAEATAREAAAVLKTQQELAARGVATRKDMVGFEASDQRAQAAVEIARADLTLAQANLDLVSADLGKAEIRSPINGVVLDRTAEAGQIVAANFEAPVLFKLAEDLERMQLLVDIDEADIGKVNVGDPADFTVEAYPGRSFPAVITQVRFAPETTNEVVTYKAVLSVANPDGLLRPGMTATAVITVDKVADALLVPNAALRYAPPAQEVAGGPSGGLVGLILPTRGGRGSAGLGSGKSVWLLRAGAPVEVAVSLGATDGRETVVTGDLAEGDAVITDQTAGAR
ncbi:MAG: efflux RND transporter periplasmic adaptor subunit [Cypionkella sp.]|uniref:efflux RND transporter periplasmic adaptor subunit n=1 Tax=Cypionkella sp. TaxID=2811411 RepID=UPI002ABA8394|nr:efflux RND transporter periplasmic adaptor subunit [Cypionkella sp.]MDZ4309554.1 efflux RND transporter periplasmic adaptor subunit [Cypionkella sp.]